MPDALELARSQPDSLKGRILVAARKAFGGLGYHGASTRRIAADVGIDVSTLYYHWGSKQDLFDGVLADIQLDFEERLRAWVHETRSLAIEECFARAVDRFGPFFLDHDIVRVVMFSFFDEEFGGEGWAVASQRSLVETMRTFAEKRFGPEALIPEFDATVLSLIASTLALIGSRKHLAQVLDLEPDGTAYRDLVLATLRRQLVAFWMTLQPTS